jgi:uncharacterized protein (DUF608 family)
MRKHVLVSVWLVVIMVVGVMPTPMSTAQEKSGPVPAAAWSRAIGAPFENPPHVSVTYPMIDDGPLQGAPLGGFGAGTFARTYAGDFARWHLDNGQHVYQTVPASMFSVYAQQGDQTVAQALWTGRQPKRGLEAWQWNYPVGAGTYYGLYPRSWFVYDWDQLPVDLSVEQFSPIIPGDYQATSYPLALFTWTATNPTDALVTIGVMFTMQDLFGGGYVHTVRRADTAAGPMVGVEMASDAIMADQLAGEWYARIAGIPTLPDDHVDRALNTIYEHNVMQYHDGQRGAVNGMLPSDTVVDAEQGREVWTGTTYMLAAHMLLEGFDQQAWDTAYGIYDYVYNTGGLWFRAPEAWSPNGDFRASMYMRPLAIWAMETALERR